MSQKLFVVLLVLEQVTLQIIDRACAIKDQKVAAACTLVAFKAQEEIKKISFLNFFFQKKMFFLSSILCFLCALATSQFSIEDDLPDELFPSSSSSSSSSPVSSSFSTTFGPVSEGSNDEANIAVMEKFTKFKEKSGSLIAQRNESLLLRDLYVNRLTSCPGASCREFTSLQYFKEVSKIISLTRDLLATIADFRNACDLASTDRVSCRAIADYMKAEEGTFLEKDLVIDRSYEFMVSLVIGLISFSLGLVYAVVVLVLGACHWRSHLDWKLLLTSATIAFICAIRIVFNSVVNCFSFLKCFVVKKPLVVSFIIF
jgi:hypothetical protein